MTKKTSPYYELKTRIYVFWKQSERFLHYKHWNNPPVNEWMNNKTELLLIKSSSEYETHFIYGMSF